MEKKESWTNMLLSSGSSCSGGEIVDKKGNSMVISVVSAPSSSTHSLPKDMMLDDTTPGSTNNIYPYIQFPNQWQSQQIWRGKLFYFLLGLIFGVTGVILWSCTLPFLKNLDSKIGQPCITPTCMKAAGRILARHGANVDPCQDFYGFACGRFVAENEIPDDSFSRSTLQEMQESILIDIKSKLLTIV